MNGNNVIVTGASGLLGQRLVTSLSADGYTVIAFGRGECPVGIREYCQWSQYDLQHFSKPGFTAGTIVHAAPLWLLPAFLEQMIGQGNVNRCVAFSSTSAVSKADAIDHHDRDLADRLINAESDILERAADRIKCTLIRPTLIYGYGQDKNISVIARFINRFGFFPVAGRANGLRQPVHVDDLAEAVGIILDNNTTFGKIYNLAGAQTLSYKSMVELIFKGLKRQPRIANLPVGVYRLLISLVGGEYSAGAANRMNQNLVFDISDARRDFGYDPQAFMENPDRDLPMVRA